MARRAKLGSASVAIGYTRASTGAQTLSHEAQRAAVTAWAAGEGVTIAGWFADEGVSGASPVETRPGFMAALVALREHGAGVLAIARRDRLARCPRVASDAELAASRAGAAVCSADGSNGSDPAAEFTRALLDNVARLERRLIGSRTRAALQAKRAKGERTGSVPYGSTLAPDGVKLLACDAEQATRARAASLRAGGLSLRAVASALESEGRLARNGRRFEASQIARILVPR